MKNLILLIGVVTALSSYADTTDYIDMKPLCEKIKSFDLNIKSNRSSCSVTKPDKYKTNHTHSVLINRVDHATEEVEQIEIKMSESDIAQVCDELNSEKYKDQKLKSLSFDVPADKKTQKRWRVSFTFGPFLSYHKKLDMRLQNEDTDVKISNLGPVQRTSHKYYAFWRDDVGFLQFIDEPQNDITVEVANGKVFFGLRYSHPKTLFQDRHDNPQINHNIDIKGTIGGVEVDETGVDLKTYMHTLSTSHGNTNINLFGGRIFNLAGKPGKNNLELRLGAGAGISFANGVSKYWAEDEDGGNRRLKITEYAGMRVYGFNITGESELRYNFMQGKMSAALKGRGLYTRIDGPIGDFKATGNLFSSQVGIAIGYTPNLFPTKREKEKRLIANIKSREDELKELQWKLEANKDNK